MQIRSQNALSKLVASYMLAVLICQVFFGYGALSPFVLCFGQNGHVAVERAGHDHTQDTFAPSGAIQQAHLAAVSAHADPSPLHGKQLAFNRQEPDQAKPCLDLPVGDEDEGGHYRLELLLQHLMDIGRALTAVAVLLFFTLQSPSLIHLRLFTTNNPISSNSALRRCIVLLI